MDLIKLSELSSTIINIVFSFISRRFKLVLKKIQSYKNDSLEVLEKKPSKWYIWNKIQSLRVKMNFVYLKYNLGTFLNTAR